MDQAALHELNQLGHSPEDTKKAVRIHLAAANRGDYLIQDSRSLISKLIKTTANLIAQGNSEEIDDLIKSIHDDMLNTKEDEIIQPEIMLTKKARLGCSLNVMLQTMNVYNSSNIEAKYQTHILSGGAKQNRLRNVLVHMYDNGKDIQSGDLQDLYVVTDPNIDKEAVVQNDLATLSRLNFVQSNLQEDGVHYELTPTALFYEQKIKALQAEDSGITVRTNSNPGLENNK